TPPPGVIIAGSRTVAAQRCPPLSPFAMRGLFFLSRIAAGNRSRLGAKLAYAMLVKYAWSEVAGGAASLRS
ncbi:MAG: hypothetical protein ACR2PG_18135, partial [Hyphomicrobiaceae bacterium]